jgi:hypothetical protein
MRSLIVGIGLLLALPNVALAKSKHKQARAHAAKKVKPGKRTKSARFAHKQNRTPVSMVAPTAAAVSASAFEPAPQAPAAASLEPAQGQKTNAVTPHEASNFATQMSDDETPGKKR